MSENILICGVNWLGDNVMSMPALAFLKKIHPKARVTVMVKSSQRALWELCGFVDDIIEQRYGFKGMMATIGEVKSRGFDRAYIFPNSFRSAFIPFVAGIKYRAGVPGHERTFLLTEVVKCPEDTERIHQSWEYMSILGVRDKAKEDHGNVDLQIPALTVPSDVNEKMLSLLRSEGKGDWVGLMPGAAHGPSKRWPASHFAEAGKSLSEKGDIRICVLGSHKEVELCEGIRRSIGERAISLAGLTSVKELAALLGHCRAVISNDSGGMHLATAMGTPVVAVFGTTDPSVTGPLGSGNRVIVNENTNHSRDIRPDSEEAVDALQAIKPARVISAVSEMLKT